MGMGPHRKGSTDIRGGGSPKSGTPSQSPGPTNAKDKVQQFQQTGPEATGPNYPVQNVGISTSGSLK